jgi:ABC-type multidrug transport system fused ATPase/permease subunit
MFSAFKAIKKLLFILDKKLIIFLPLLGLFLISGVLDLISLGMIAPYISFVIDPDVINNNKFARFMPFKITDENKSDFFIYFSFSLILIFFLKALFSILIRALINRFALKNLENLQVRLVSAYQNMNYSDFIKRNTTEYIRNVRELSAQCTLCLDLGLRIVSELIVLIAIVFFLLTIKPVPLIVLVIIIILSLLLYNFYLKPKTVEYGKKKIEASKLVYQGVLESIKGFKEIKLLEKQNFFSSIVKKGAREIFRNEFKNSIIVNSPRYFLEFIIIMFVISFLLINTISGNQDVNILPTIGIFAVAALRILPGASIIINGLLMISHYKSGIDLVYKDIDKFSKIKIDNKNLNRKEYEENFNEIKLENISFKYPISDKFIFKNLNFTLKNNDCIGIIGETGSGKTTLIDILLGLLKPTEGKIMLNDKELNLNKLPWSKKIAYLPQDHLILDGTIIKNITLLEDSEEVDDYKITKSLKQANLEKLIKDLPDGVNTTIGGKGIRLSGGQYKKICLARLFYHEKDILIMDEATNSLDKRSEELIVDEIARLKGKKTIVVITHNLSTLKYCDQIYKIENMTILKNFQK